jgi:UDP-hydrolysing UDP-N-acetyl-D-glucosamine 2-epimerase
VRSQRTIAVVTTTRADYGLWYWILRAIQQHPDLRLQLIVGGTHLRPEHGLTRRFIEQDGFAIDAEVDFLPSGGGDADADVAVAGGRAGEGFARQLHKLRPDMVLLLGDRFETLAAAFAAATLRIPVGHLHGGETTEGALDESYRHAITKLSHIHFPATEQAASRVIQLGEQPDRVHVVGAAGLETIAKCRHMDLEELSTAIGIGLEAGFLLVTYHPATLSAQSPEDQVTQLINGLATAGRQLLISRPNADAGSAVVAARLEEFCHERSNAHLVASAGQEAYINLMRHAAAMVGNSSSGIIEAPSVPLAAVNVGPRQQGRQQAANVIDVPCEAGAIADGLERALSDEFRRCLTGLVNPYGDGRTSQRIVRVLAEVELGPAVLVKRFHTPLPSEVAV